MAAADVATVSKNPVSDYFGKITGFSRNAKLYMVHFMLMAFRIGAWEVAFSLYLLDQGFSVAQGAGRIAIMLGALAAGFIPIMLATDGHVGAGAYRVALLVGTAIWFVSLIPAFMFREREDVIETLRSARSFSFKNLQSLSFIRKIVLVHAFYWLGVGLIHPLHDVFFAEKRGATVDEVGIRAAARRSLLAS